MFRNLINKLIAQYLLREYKRHLTNDIHNIYEGIHGTDEDDYYMELRNEMQSSNIIIGVAYEEVRFNGEDNGAENFPLILHIIDSWLGGTEHALS